MFDPDRPRWLTLVLAFIAAAPAAVAPADEADDDLRARLDRLEQDNAELRRELAELKDLHNGSWLNNRRAEEIRALVHEVLADADTRASRLNDTLTAGRRDGAFFIASEDGRFLLRIGGLIQARYTFSHREMAPGGLDQMDDTEAGFVLPRIRFEISGHIGDPRFHYAIRYGPDREDNEVLGEKAVIGYDVKDDLSVWFGEDKAGFLREETMFAGHLMAADRSLMNEVFTAGYIQGVWMNWQPKDDLHLYFSINDGYRSGEADNESNSANLTAPPGDGDLEPIHKPFFLDRTDIAFTARAEWLAAGDWNQFIDFASWQGEPAGLLLGAAVHADIGETGSSPGGGNSGHNDNFLVWTADISFEKEGLSLFGAIAGFHTDLDVADNFDMYGAVLQASYMAVPDKIEPFVRFEWIDLDGRNAPADNDIYIVTAGFNYYIHRHHAKFTADVMWVASDLPDSSVLGLQDNDGFDQSLGAIGLRADDGRNQFVIRIQFQLMF